MMKVLIGVCGLGNGHSIRQHVLVDKFLAEGHQVALFTNRGSTQYFRKTFPGLESLEVWNPYIMTDGREIKFAEIACHPENDTTAAYQYNFAGMDRLLSLFGGAPDLVIADYEPIAAQFAYATSTPLVTIDNQSLCLGYELPELPPFSPREEIGRLGMFFPHAELRISLSLVPGRRWQPRERFRVVTVPPIIRGEFMRLGRESARANHFVVYISPYAPLRQTTRQIVKILKRCSGSTFVVFNGQFRRNVEMDNVVLAPFSLDRFIAELSRASGVIATAGFTLLSEAMHLRLPFYGIPFNTYEQNFNCRLIDQLGIGGWGRELSLHAVRHFIEMVPQYQARLASLTPEESYIDGDGLATTWNLMSEQFPHIFANREASFRKSQSG